MFEITDQDHDEIIAINVNNIVYLGSMAIEMAIKHNNVDCVYGRSLFKLLAELDLDPRWAEYATYPTLFKMSELKIYCSPIARQGSSCSGSAESGDL